MTSMHFMTLEDAIEVADCFQKSNDLRPDYTFTPENKQFAYAALSVFAKVLSGKTVSLKDETIKIASFPANYNDSQVMTALIDMSIQTKAVIQSLRISYFRRLPKDQRDLIMKEAANKASDLYDDSKIVQNDEWTDGPVFVIPNPEYDPKLDDYPVLEHNRRKGFVVVPAVKGKGVEFFAENWKVVLQQISSQQLKPEDFVLESASTSDHSLAFEKTKANLKGYSALNHLENNGVIKNYHYLALDANGNLGHGDFRNTESLELTFNDGSLLTIDSAYSGSSENTELFISLRSS